MKITESDYDNLFQMAKYGPLTLAHEICALFKTRAALVIGADGSWAVVHRK